MWPFSGAWAVPFSQGPALAAPLPVPAGLPYVPIPSPGIEGGLTGYHRVLHSLMAAASPIPGLASEVLAAPPAAPDVAQMSHGMSLHGALLSSAGRTASRSISTDVWARRLRLKTDWDAWAAQFPLSVRPSLLRSPPATVLAFLEHWRCSHRGRSTGPDSEAGGSSDAPEVAPGTLRAACGHLSALFSMVGRSGSWCYTHPSGNPCAHDSVTSYLRGYERARFAEDGYSPAGAVPMEIATYIALATYLASAADAAPAGTLERAQLWRDFSAFAYLWETVIVESSLGTKTRATRHPGVLRLHHKLDPESGARTSQREVPRCHCVGLAVELD
eukprot:jgi/Tetstr1/442064/TSEL_030243.t1